MCDVVGYIGGKQVKLILLDCLSNLEYQDYDSLRVAVFENSVKVCKAKSRVGVLQEESPQLNGTLGVAYTR